MKPAAHVLAATVLIASAVSSSLYAQTPAWRELRAIG